VRDLKLVSVLLAVAALASASKAGDASSAAAVVFIENAGQWDTPARFVGRAGSLTVRLQPDAILLQQADSVTGCGALVRLAFEGARTGAALRGEDRQPGTFNFFIGDDHARWRSGLPGFSEVVYRDLYPGVDLRVRAGPAGVRLELLLAPGADPESVVVRCDGADSARVDEEGCLIMETAVGTLRQSLCATWQRMASGDDAESPWSFRVLDGGRFGLSGADRQPDLSLVSGSGLEWSTFLGGSAGESSPHIAFAPDGDVVVAGGSWSWDFPTTPGAFDTTLNGQFFDVCVTRLDPAASELVYSTFIGSAPGSEIAVGIGAGSDGTVTVAGLTTSAEFPTTPGAFDTTYAPGGDAFISRLTSDGQALVFSTFLGGTGGELVLRMVAEPSGTTIVVGETESQDFPITHRAFDMTPDAPLSRDLFVSRLSADGSALLQSTYLGGAADDFIGGVAVSEDGSVIVVGFTDSLDFPISASAFDSVLPGNIVAKLDPTLGRLDFSTVLTSHWPTADQRTLAAAVGPGGSVTVTGWVSEGYTFPVTPGAFDTTYDGQEDIFVTRLDPTGSSLVWSTFLGGVLEDKGVSLAVDSAGVTTIAGYTKGVSLVFPTTPGAWSTENSGTWDDFVARLSPDGHSLWYSTFLGGSGAESPASPPGVFVALAPEGSAVVASFTNSADFPVTSGAYDTSYNGATDGFISKLTMLPTGVNRVGTSTPGCAGFLASGVTAMPQVGKSFGLTCTNATPSSAQGVLLLSLRTLPEPAPAKGAQLWVDPAPLLLLIPVASNDLGFVWLPGAIPNNPGLAGASFAVQFFWPDTCAAPGPYSASNALALTIQP
jgi:hypothetical protein